MKTDKAGVVVSAAIIVAINFTIMTVLADALHRLIHQDWHDCWVIIYGAWFLLGGLRKVNS